MSDLLLKWTFLKTIIKQNMLIHDITQQMDSRTGLSRPEPKTGKPQAFLQTSSQTEIETQTEPVERVAPMTKTPNPYQRSGLTDPRWFPQTNLKALI